MPSFSDNPAGRYLLLFGLLALPIVGFVLWGGMRRNEHFAELEGIYRHMARVQSSPLPSDTQSLGSLNQSIAALEEGLLLKEGDLFRGSLGSFSTEISGSSTAAFFELAGFIEDAYAKLEANGIAYVAGDRFGFSQFARQGPETTILDAVMEQKLVAEHLMGQMIAAKPTRLTGMKREWIAQESVSPQSALAQIAGKQTPAAPVWDDTIAQRKDRPGYVSYVFEVGFEGYSDALRIFLTGLMAAPVPLLVDDLRVEPLDRYAGDELDLSVEDAIPQNPFDLLNAAQDDTEEGGPMPIIRSNLSSFTVTVEAILRKQDQVQ